MPPVIGVEYRDTARPHNPFVSVYQPTDAAGFDHRRVGGLGITLYQRDGGGRGLRQPRRVEPYSLQVPARGVNAASFSMSVMITLVSFSPSPAASAAC